MRGHLDGVLVAATCSTCGARITATYEQVKSIGIFACGCGTIVDANMTNVTAQAMIGLVNDDGSRPALFSVGPRDGS